VAVTLPASSAATAPTMLALVPAARRVNLLMGSS
jgi:hypothetical protein